MLHLDIITPTATAGASKSRVNDAFSVIGHVGGEAEKCCHEVHFETHTPWAIKKRATFIFTITLANVDRFQ